MNVNLVQDYHPWTATFIDKTSLSRLTNPNVSFKEVEQKKEILHSFEIHTSPDHAIGVRLKDGFFYYRYHFFVEEFTAPGHVLAPKYELIYFRTCGGEFIKGKITAEVVDYHLGWRTPGGQEQRMRIYPTGKWEWC